jgi:uncharacterized protein (DUF169 family)
VVKTDVLERCERRLLGVTNTRAVALTFSDVPPPGLAHEPEARPSGCTFWKLANEGRVFYTEAADHFGCAVGAYTHGSELPDAQAHELSGLVSTMVSLSYLQQEEVAQIPRRTAPLRYVSYTPLDMSPGLPDVVLVRGNARQLMLLTEAARAAGRLENSRTMGRPACAMVPASIASGNVVVSLGCVGNRVYTDLEDEDGYLAIPGSALEAVCDQLEVIVRANHALAQFHWQRRAHFANAGSA